MLMLKLVWRKMTLFIYFVHFVICLLLESDSVTRWSTLCEKVFLYTGERCVKEDRSIVSFGRLYWLKIMAGVIWMINLVHILR